MQEGIELLLEYLISVIESRDFFAEHHCEKVKKFTEIMLEKVRRFCPEYKLDEQDCRYISFAAMMHDLGKIAIPDNILHKPGKLTFEEVQIMQNHTRKGRRIFENIQKAMEQENMQNELFQYCAEVCMHHHERYDGAGYPMGLKKNEIPISAQVVGLADAYDALVSERIYKPAYSREEAFEMIMKGECGIFNPRLMEIFSMVRMELEEVQEEIERKDEAAHQKG
ncbi:MAG: HD-GYP domain-containing protein [Eubacterium sp.]